MALLSAAILILATAALGGPATADNNAHHPSADGPVGELPLPRLRVQAARLQAEFVRASLDLEQARLELRAARTEVRKATAAATAAQRTADAERDRLASYLTLLYTQGPQMDPELMILLTGFRSADAMWKQNLVFQEVSGEQADEVEVAMAAQDQADILHAQARQRQGEADDAQDMVAAVLARITQRADEVTAAAEAAFTDNEEAALFADAEQRARNAAAVRAWDGSLSRSGRSGTPLPRPVVRAVNRAFAALGKPFAAGNSGPETYDCAGLVRAAYSPMRLGTTPAAEYEQTRVVRRRDVRVGDLVFFATPGAGIHHVGIYVGGDLMVAADGPASQVGVLAFPSRPYAITRPTLPTGHAHHRAPEGDGSQKMSCGTELLAGGASATGMTSPVAEGDFHYTARFGDPGPRWESGLHTGLDFAAPVGTPVVAAREGVVSVSHPAWAGNLVAVDHGSGVVTRYAHLSAVFVTPGERVLSGQTIGSVGMRGNATGPHLHFEVDILGTPVDPMLFLASGAGAEGSSGWGGFLNGMIPTSELCSLDSAPGHLLRCDAARAYDALALAYRADFGTPPCITDSYRSFSAQVAAFANKPKLTAVPGTSNHGWGLAVDLCGGIETPGTVQHEWMQEHAGLFGWVHPAWAEPGGGRPEPWHWEFGQLS